MPVTLLLDLDDTLLNTNMEAFIPAYFKAFSRALADMVTPEACLPALLGGTQAMFANLDPALSLRQVFDAYFFPKLNIDRDELQPRIDRFYEEDFPKLGALTSRIPEAVRLVDWAFEQGLRVVIATNPVFPLRAVQYRMRWAGLPPEQYPFELVTNYENMHFTKEMVAYYPEILAQLGWPDDPAVMVGDDVEREIKPTRAAGFPVYWIRKTADFGDGTDGIPQGTLASVRGWLEKTDPAALKIDFDTPQALVANLRSTPAGLATLTASLPVSAWQRPPAAGEWSLTEILCHLRDVEREVHLPRLRKVLAETNPFLVGEVTDVWVKQRHCADQDGHQTLAEFTAVRKETVAILDALQSEWSRPARHAIFGPTTLQELVGFMAGHDRAHVQQVWKTIRA